MKIKKVITVLKEANGVYYKRESTNFDEWESVQREETDPAGSS